MKIDFLVLLMPVVIIASIAIWCPVSYVAYSAMILIMIYFVYSSISLLIQIQKTRIDLKQRLRFMWYNKMGLLESSYIIESKHAVKYWRNLLNALLK